MIGVSACSRERPTFGVPWVQDAGDPGDDTQDVDAGKHQPTHGEAGGDATTDSSNGGGSSATAEDMPDSGHNRDTTSSSEADDTETDETTDSDDADAGAAPHATSDDGGVECPSGRYAANDGECQAWTECVPGSYISSPGSATSDQECSACEEATFSDVSNAADCTSWDHCGWFEISKAGTDTSNVECLEADRFDQFGTDLGDTVMAIAANSNGTMAVTGILGSLNGQGADAHVRVYNPGGEVRWARDFGTDSQDEATGVTLDPDGSVVVVGFTAGLLAGESSTYLDIFVRRYDADGEILWTRQVDLHGDDDFARAVASDGAGNSVVVGSTSGFDNTSTYFREAIVRKYDVEGDVLWTRQFDAPSAEGVAVGPNGSIAVVGTVVDDSSGAGAGADDIFLRLYTSDGELLWARHFGSDEDDFSKAVSFTASGHIAVGGHTWGQLSGDHLGERDAFLRLYEPDGTVLWTQQFGSEQGDSIWGVTTSQSDHIVVAGTTSGALSGDNAGMYDLFVRRYDLAGVPLWTRQLGTDGGDSASALALVGQSEFVAVAGETTGALSGDNLGVSDAFVGFIRTP